MLLYHLGILNHTFVPYIDKRELGKLGLGWLEYIKFQIENDSKCLFNKPK